MGSVESKLCKDSNVETFFLALNFFNKAMKLIFAVFLSAIAIVHGAPSDGKGHAERSNDYVVAKPQKDLATLSQSYAKEVSQLKLRQSDVELAASIINEENLRQLIRSEIKAHRPCALGTKKATEGLSNGKGFDSTYTINFGRTFDSEPEVIVAISDFYRNQQGTNDQMWGLTAEVTQKTTDSFDVRLVGYGTQVDRLAISWVACQ